MIPWKKIAAFTAIFPLLFLITGMLLDGLLFSSPNYPPILLELFEPIAFILSLILTYLLTTYIKILHKPYIIIASPIVNIFLGYVFMLSLWRFAPLIAFTCALLAPTSFVLSRMAKENTH